MTPNQTVAFHTFGCKLNFSETSTISRQFESAGYGVVSFNQPAAYYVINTCSVTEKADKKCQQLVRSIKRQNPSSKVIITGCYAQLKPEEILNLKGVDLVVGAQDKFSILEHIEKSNTSLNTKIKDVKSFKPAYSLGDRTRSFFKVQDGCDYFCSFCTIPLARGTSRNASIKETVKVAKEIAKHPIKEVVLTGVNIGDFGKSTNENFLDLITALDTISGIERFRISSIEPNLLSNNIIDFVANSKKFVPHFHIPLQSGDNEILKSMRRRYNKELYTERIQYIREKLPDACIGVDVIVGFPGETQESFESTHSYLNLLEVSYLHVFPYSERMNTTAKRMQSNRVDIGVRKQRSQQLQLLSKKKQTLFYQKHIGKKRNVLFENENKDGFMYGFTDNYLKVKKAFDPSLKNTIFPVMLNKLEGFEFLTY